jgi:hypothetical protein
MGVVPSTSSATDMDQETDVGQLPLALVEMLSAIARGAPVLRIERNPAPMRIAEADALW